MWDNYRTQMPLLALIDPVRAEAIARSLVRLYASGKNRWATPDEPFLTVRTEHAGIALLDFRRKGITGFDAQTALAGMVAESPTLARCTPDEAIEAAYDDWATAELAADLGQTGLARSFHDKAKAYRPMWLDTFRDLGPDSDVVKARGLYQGTLAQYRWAPVFDLPWLSEAMGPRLIPELERFFGDNLFNITNQPDLHVPYLLAWAGQRDASLATVRLYLTSPVAHRYTNSGVRPEPWFGRSFALAPQGFADGMDDDAGTMSAWYIWATLGLYPLTPGEPRYLVTEPVPAVAILRPLPNVEIALRKGPNGLLMVGQQAIRSKFVEHTMLIAAPGKEPSLK
jgi:putative alpha-1,2-mannosidase